MYIPFEEMANTSRVWIYQANRVLSTKDQLFLDQKCKTFLEQWAAHGQSLKSSFQVVHDKFLIVSVDESFNQASGCSIDASVALVKSLEQSLDISFFDRTQVCFLIDNEIIEIPINGIKTYVENGKINEDTLTFNNLVDNIGAFNKEWKIAAKNSWLKRYFQ
ncbi:hypothetical protein N7E81_06280 [Reichenbachiella carrageenanivorans]|uniref:ABC transporter ATPase n=1 Tax=Reichenbachiella carrageenanivorans TaxID=2979869 RepID=A0ABY6D4H2_9BACT|nr:hypothetical protein [Reichenbachiella carrageenanivorans]UXX80704.1 hypothetical protein N7E81_06280 [Reichenbachiella carrageenanivorans]